MDFSQKKKEMPMLLRPIIIGCTAGAIVTFLMLLLFALVLTLQDLPTVTMTIMSTLAVGFGALVAGICSARIYGKNGLITGAFSGLILFLLVLFISFFMSDSGFSVYSLIKLIIMLVCSSIGGVIGINFKHKRKFI